MAHTTIAPLERRLGLDRTAISAATAAEARPAAQAQSRSRTRFWLAVLAAAGWTAAMGEVVYRFTDGFEITTPALKPRQFTPPAPTGEPSSLERRLLQGATFDPAVRTDWFFTRPPVIAKPIPEEIAARTRLSSFGGTENYIWNERYLQQGDPSLVDLFRLLRTGDVFAFRSFDQSIYPRYRVHEGVNGGVGSANNFGHLFTHDMPLAKPAGTIRIAWVGDSTSHNAIGRYLQAYLDHWSAEQSGRPRFEVINAARQASDLNDMRVALRYELAPLGVDYVYSITGLRMAYDQMQWGKIIHLPEGMQFYTSYKPEQRLLAGVLAPLEATSLVKHSALARHAVLNLAGTLPTSELHEPAKPSARIEFPSGIDEARPDPDSVRHLYNLGRKLEQLDAFAATASELGITPVVSTEMIYVHPGMTLRQVPQRWFFDTVNGPSYWPLSYADIRRLADFQNRIIAEWARRNGVTLAETARRIPPLPVLSGDAVHDFETGIRLRAWVAFQTLLPLIRNDIAAGHQPRPARPAGETHPYLNRPPLRIRLDALVADYADRQTQAQAAAARPRASPPAPDAGFAAQRLPLAGWRGLVAGALIEGTGPVTVRLPAGRTDYGASLPVASPGSGPGRVRVEVAGLAGRSGICLIARDGKQLGACQGAHGSGDQPGRRVLRFVVPDTADVAAVAVANFEAAGERPVDVVVHAIELLKQQ